MVLSPIKRPSKKMKDVITKNGCAHNSSHNSSHKKKGGSNKQKSTKGK